MEQNLSTYRFPSDLRGSILEGIVNAKLREINAAKKKWPADSIDMTLDRAPQIRSLKRALLNRPPGIIAEIKKGSPSAGVLRADFDPFKIAEEYEKGGATAISVLTEGRYFGGGLEILAGLRWRSKLPLLRKDFVVDPYQILEARHAGADAVLLIAALLDAPSLRLLHEKTELLGMEALVEVHSEEELDRAIEAGASFIGVNNRDLRNFQISLKVALGLAPRLPKEVVAVAESGIHTSEDIRRLSDAGYRGFLVGEILMRAASPGAALSKLLPSRSDRQRIIS